MNNPLEGYEVEELGVDETGEGSALFQRFQADLHSDAIELPSLPRVAQRLHEAVQDPEMDLGQLAHIVGQDAGIAARILRTANSPLYRGETPCRELADGISRLGFDRTRQLVMAFTMQNVFVVKDPTLMYLMEDHWRHSRDVAVTSYVLAEKSGNYEPERALLMGLMHDLGVVPLIAHAVELGGRQQDVNELPSVLAALKGEVGYMLLKRWGFDEELLITVKEVDVLQRETIRPDYCDLVQMAHYCVDFLAGTASDAPAAFDRSRTYDAAGCLKELTASRDEVRELRSLVELD